MGYMSRSSTSKEEPSRDKCIRPFQDQLRDEVAQFRETYYRGLRDVELQTAFDDLVQTWSQMEREVDVAHIPTMLDLMTLAAVIENKKRIQRMNELLDKIEEKIKAKRKDSS